MFRAVVNMGQFVPGNSCIHLLDPRIKMICVVVAAVVVFLVSNWQGFLLLTTVVFVAMGLTGIGIWTFLRGLLAIWILLLFTLFFNAWLTPGEVLFQAGFFQVTIEGLLRGSRIFLQLTLLVLVVFMLTLTTSPLNLTAGLESILSPFRPIGVPAHELAMMMTVALRFVPTLMSEAERITKAQRSRGAGFGAGGMLSRVKGLIPLFVPLFAGAILRAEELAVAMDARCYRGGVNRTRMKDLVLAARDYVALLLVVVLLGLVLWDKFWR